MSSLDKDLPLKLEMMKYFWNLGYFVRSNVNLRNFKNNKDFTDIDVFAIKFDLDFNHEICICECKSGHIKINDRLFWLSGLKEFFGAKRGYLVNKNVSPMNYSELSKKLNLILLGSKEIMNLNKKFSIPKPFNIASFGINQDKYISYLKLIKDNFPQEYNYISYKYWMDTPKLQFLRIINILKKMILPYSDKNKISIINPSHVYFFISYSISLMFIALLRFLKEFFYYTEIDTKNHLMKSLQIGEMELNTRNELLHGIYIFLKKEIQKRYKENYPLSEDDFIHKFKPLYLDHLVDLILRIQNEPSSALLVPRFFDMMAFDVFVDSKPLPDINFLFLGLKNDNLKTKPIKDFLKFLERIKIYNEKYFAKCYEMIDNIEKII